MSRAQSSLGVVLCLAGVLGMVQRPMADDVWTAVNGADGTAARSGATPVASDVNVAGKRTSVLAAAESETVLIAIRTFNPNSLALGDFGDLDQQ